MKACLYIGGRGNEWIWELFPGKSPGEMPLAGKSWCRHAVDLCSQLGVTDVYIADCFMYDELRTRVGNGEFWNLKLHFSRCAECANPTALFGQLPELGRSDDDLLLFWGQVLPDISAADQLLEELRPVAEMPAEPSSGIWLRRGGKWHECTPPLHRMDSPKRYFDLNFKLLDRSGVYTLPCYSAQPGVRIGRNVVMMPNCHITPPVVIQDDCLLGRSVSLRNGAIIGHEVMVDDASEIIHSVILGRTCIGKNMQIRNKIVSGSTVVDADSGTFVEINDELLVSGGQQLRFSRYATAECLTALVTALLLSPLYLLTRPFKRQLDALAFFKLMFRIYPKCWLAACGRYHMVRLGIDSTNYVFRYSDKWLKYQTDHQRDMADIFFLSHRDVRLMISVVIASLFKRLFVVTETPAQTAADQKPEQ